MNRLRAGVLGLLILGLLIGGGFFAYTTLTDSDAPTTDNQPEGPPNDTPEPPSETLNTSGPLPPGVTADQDAVTVEHDTLLKFHAQTLRTESATVTFSVQSSQTQRETTYETTPSETLVTTQTRTEDTVTYSNGQVSLTKTTTANGATYSASGTTISTEKYTRQPFFTAVLAASRVTQMDTRNESETTLTTLQTRLDGDGERAALALSFDTIDELRAEFTITEAGVIRNATVRVVGEINGRAVVEEYEYTATEIRRTSVTEPQWTDTARAENTIVSADYDRSKGWIVMRHDGLATIPAGAQLTLRDGQGDYTTLDVPTEMSEGDRLYIRPYNGNWEMYVNEQPPGPSDESLAAHYDVTVRSGGVTLVDLRVS